jgi:hypothetical protein
VSRLQDVLDARIAADAWAASKGLPPSGGYSGDWYRLGYLGGWWPEGWLQWWADYSKPPGALLSDTVVGHQYTSTPVDRSLFDDAEVNAPVANGCTDLINALAYVCDDLGAQLAAEDKRPNIRHTVVRQIIAEMARVREQMLGPKGG